MAKGYLQPAVLGGLVIGVLSGLPVISAGNLCCCLWVLAGGALAAFLHQQSQPGAINAGDGAIVGLLAGVVGAFVYLVVSIPVVILVSPMERVILERLSRSSSDLPPEWRSIMDGGFGPGVRIALGFFFMLFASPVFATLGGLLGTALFRKSAQAPIDTVRTIE
jgi:hypothetical protein